MGTRYIVSVKCPDCGVQEEAYYAPTCDFVEHTCVCGNVIDLEKYTGIPTVSSLAEIKRMIDSIQNKPEDDWTDVWPVGSGHYWFFGRCSKPLMRWKHKPEMILVKVRKMMNSIAYVGNGRFIYKGEGAHGLWKKAVLPEPPDLEEP